MSPAASTTIPDLQTDCAAQMARYRQERANDPTPCLLLFRSAILQREPAAWEALVEIYRPYVRRWVRGRGCTAGVDVLDELVQQALVRFWRAFTPQQFARSRYLADILGYWRDCANSACCDWLRRGRNAPEPLEEADGGPIPRALTTDTLQHDLEQAESRSRLWRVVTEQCQDEADRVLVQRIFVEGQKPRDVLRENPSYFASIELVYKRLRNLKDRLRREPELLKSLEMCG